MLVLPQQIKEYRSINIKTRHPNWSATTTYNFSQVEGDANTVFDEHYYYRSIIDNNLGNDPRDNSSKWLKWSISNRYAQIDLRSTTKTVWDPLTATDPNDHALIAEFDNNVYDTIALGNIEGDNIKVEVFDAGGTLIMSSEEVIYSRPNSNTWYNYYFDEFESIVLTKDATFFRIPPQSGGYIRVTVTANGTTDIASVGYMVAGISDYAGCSLFGLQLGLNDNSLVDTDDFGVTVITKRIANETMDIDVLFPKEQIEDKIRKARKVFGDIVLFIGDESDNSAYNHLFLLGYVQDYNVVLEDMEQITASWSVVEVI